MQRTLDARKPKSRYRIGYMAGFAAMLELMPQGVAEAIMAMMG